MKKIKMNREGKDLFIKISGVEDSEAEIIAKMLGITIGSITGIQASPDADESTETEADRMVAEMAAGADEPPVNDAEAGQPLDIPPEETQESEDSEGFQEILSIASDNKKITAMGAVEFIRKAAPYVSKTIEDFGITDLEKFLEKGEKKKKGDLANIIVKELRKLLV